MENKKTLEQTLIESIDLHNWTLSSLEGVPFPANRRLLIAISSLDLALDHFAAITALIERRICGSAFALARPLFEAFIRAVWLKDCATDEELSAFERDEFPRNFGQVLLQVEELESFKSGALSGLKKQAWEAMNSYTHGGIQQIARRVKAKMIDPNYLDEEIIEVLRLSQVFGLMAFIQLVLIAGRRDLEKLAIDKLYALELFKRK